MTKKQRKILPVWVYSLIYAAVAAVCVAIDQLTKHFIEKAVAAAPGRTIRIIGDWLTLVWTTNDGATGSMFSDFAGRNWLFFTMTIVGLPVFGWLWWRARTRSVWGQVAFSFIIGGTLGNACDRLFLAEDGFFTGAVRDFIRVDGFFGIFNMADSFLVVGVIMALLAILFFDPDSLLRSMLAERKKAAANAEQTETDAAQTAEHASATESDSEQPSETDSQNPDEKD